VGKVTLILGNTRLIHSPQFEFLKPAAKWVQSEVCWGEKGQFGLNLDQFEGGNKEGAHITAIFAAEMALAA
jgi:hypothetical protein